MVIIRIDSLPNSSSKRNPIFDIMKGIGMLGVMMAHTETIPDFPYRRIILTYCIPIFFFLGGYFHHSTTKYREKLGKDFKRLIFPYLFTSSVIIVYALLFSIHFHMPNVLYSTFLAAFWGSGYHHYSLLWGDIQPIGAIWFLLALFWCRIVYDIIMTKAKYPKIVCLLISILSTVLDYYVINLPFCILPGLSCMVYYLIGDICKDFKRSIPVLIVLAVCFILGVLYSHISVTNCDYGCYPLDIICAAGASYFVYLLSIAINKVKFLGICLEWIGKFSLVFLCFHLIDLNCSISRYFHIPRDWYYLMPFQIAFCTVATIISLNLKTTRYIFSIR